MTTRYRQRTYEVAVLFLSSLLSSLPGKRIKVRALGPLLAARKVARKMRGSQANLVVRQLDNARGHRAVSHLYHWNGQVLASKGRASKTVLEVVADQP